MSGEARKWSPKVDSRSAEGASLGSAGNGISGKGIGGPEMGRIPGGVLSRATLSTLTPPQPPQLPIPMRVAQAPAPTPPVNSLPAVFVAHRRRGQVLNARKADSPREAIERMGWPGL